MTVHYENQTVRSKTGIKQFMLARSEIYSLFIYVLTNSLGGSYIGRLLRSIGTVRIIERRFAKISLFVKKFGLNDACFKH
ncbi:MAG: hypothetical protein HC941_23830 [Microcoleus sp. SU_5_3]|nr:hypothetical protein [Microcoleus sp. SU_5_3]